MITLKDYQNRVLDSLRDFLRHCAKHGDPAAAFQAIQERNYGRSQRYIPVQMAGLTSGMPYVCLRVPTGGGKTFLACHAVGVAMHELLRADRAVVLWLVHRNTILDQTADALRDSRHPYRRALEMACGPVEIMTINEALRISRPIVDGQTVVIVATIQSFRVEDTTGRKVYDTNGAFLEHVQNPPLSRVDDLLPGPDGKPVPSLVNMLRLRRPIVIVDEAHNARTELSYTALGNVMPSCIIEFTATPVTTGKDPSNVLHHVSAAELKAADMVKLPLRVVTRHPSQKDQLLAEALRLRADLEKLATQEAQQTGEYIRPILLLQPERVDACEPLREKLISDFNLTKDEIKICVGRLDELKDVDDIDKPSCPVKIILTVEKLREGWDCPFAYVLCSLKETRSATAIEQIVGRVLRLPKATSKRNPDLNCAYVLSVTESIAEVLAELKDALQSNGFTPAEAQRIVIPAPQGELPLGVQPQTIHVEIADIDAGIVAVHSASLTGKASVDSTNGSITVNVPLSADDTELLVSFVRPVETKKRIIDLVNAVRDIEIAFGGTGAPRTPSPYQLNLDFVVPVLSVNENGQLFEFNKDYLLDHPWKLSEKDASLSDAYNPLERPLSKLGVVDVGERSEILTDIVREEHDTDFVAQLHKQVAELASSEDWTLESLVAWLDRRLFYSAELRHQIVEGESAAFLLKVIRGLMAKFDISEIDALAIDRYRLLDEIETRIEQHSLAEQKKAHQLFLNDGSPLVVSGKYAINFRTMMYEPSNEYRGGYTFAKHYFGPRPGELDEKKSDGSLKEEFQCAQFIDAHPSVHFWVRNLPQKPTSFRLQTATGWFYPDFVCQLKDGRIMVVEYKGAHLVEVSSEVEKRVIGELWESRSNGKCAFVMPTGGDFSVIDHKIANRG